MAIDRQTEGLLRLSEGLFLRRRAVLSRATLSHSAPVLGRTFSLNFRALRFADVGRSAARRRAQQGARAIDEGIVDSLEEKLAHPTATVHELVDGFVLPEVERQIARREELAEDGKYASAAGKELEKVVAAVELATGGY